VDGDFQQVGMFVRPHSLYDEQLRERLGHEPDGQEDYSELLKHGGTEGTETHGGPGLSRSALGAGRA
jgi:hypothetical protein